MKKRFISNKYIRCNKCDSLAPAYYTLSLLTKGLWVQCKKCGTHCPKYIPNLDLPYRPSKHYLSKMPSSSADQSGQHQQLQMYK